MTDHPRSVQALDLASLPPRLRPAASLGVLDATEWFGDTTGGIRTYLLEKARYVESRPTLRHTLLVPGSHDLVSDGDGTRQYRLHGPRIPRQHPYRLMLRVAAVSRLVRHEAPDVVEVGSPFLSPWILARITQALRVPLVCFYHANLPRLFAARAALPSRTRTAVHGAAVSAAWHYMRRLDRLFARTVVTSAYAANDLAREGITRVSRVPLGVDLSCFSPALRERAQETRGAHGLPGGPLAMFVGRLAAEKELEVLLEAWATVERQCGARLALIGTGPMEQRLRAHGYAHRVYWLPFQSDRAELAALLASADLYVAPGRIETFGLSSLEALACGTPVLSASEGGVSEQVSASGAGATFDSGIAASLAEQAIALFRGDLASQGRRGRVYAEREHGWDAVFDRLMGVYRDVIAT